MNTPITFRDVDPSPALQAHVATLIEKLQREVGAVTSCRVTIGTTNRSQKRGDRYQVHVELHVPSNTLRADLTSGERDDLYATLDTAFDDLRVRLHQHFERARERRNEH
jgi:ribosomal subunit interface protein